MLLEDRDGALLLSVLPSPASCWNVLDNPPVCVGLGRESQEESRRKGRPAGSLGGMMCNSNSKTPNAVNILKYKIIIANSVSPKNKVGREEEEVKGSGDQSHRKHWGAAVQVENGGSHLCGFVLSLWATIPLQTGTAPSPLQEGTQLNL